MKIRALIAMILPPNVVAGAVLAIQFMVIGAFVFAATAQTRQDPLPPEQVFIFSASASNQTAEAVFSMPKDFYLYRQRILLTTATPGFQVVSADFPSGVIYEDEFFGETEIYYDGVTIAAQIDGQGEFELQVISQGCDKQLGICYPPQTHVAALVVGDNVAAAASSIDNNINVKSAVVADEAAAAAAVIADNNLLFIMLAFFGFGILLSFTPCVLPMIPILLGILGGGKEVATGGRQRVLLLTASYIGGVTVIYTSLGVAAGLSGRLLAPFLQQPIFLIFSAFVFVALAFSMFGLYDIQAPQFIRNRSGKGGGALGAFMLGGLSAVAVSPCVAAPLIGALIYIGNSGDAFTGGAALLSLSLGMSVLLAVAGIGGSAVLPRAGAWMNDVKQLLGALLLLAAVWVSSSLYPPAVSLMLYGGLLIFCGMLLGALSANAPKAARSAGIIVLLWGSAMILGAAGGGRDPLAPLSPFIADKQSPTLTFTPIQSLTELRLKTATANRPVMLEFYADWCVSCKEMEKFTFSDEQVQRRLQNMLLLRADVTADNADHRELLKRFGLYGPPAILFFDADGELISGVRVNGYQSATEFLQTLAATGV